MASKRRINKLRSNYFKSSQKAPIKPPVELNTDESDNLSLTTQVRLNRRTRLIY